MRDKREKRCKGNVMGREKLSQRTVTKSVAIEGQIYGNSVNGSLLGKNEMIKE